MHQIKFYARTWMLWAGWVFFCQLMGTLAVTAPLFCFDLIKAADGRPGGLGSAMPLIINLFIFLPVFIVVTFHLLARQKPILYIRKEGIELRVIGTPIHVVRYGHLGLPFLPIELYWQLLTGQMFQTRTMRLPWDNFHTVTYEHGRLVITGLVIIKDGRLWTEQNPFSFAGHTFGVSTQTVAESLQYYVTNTFERENLPSWEQTEEFFKII